MLVAENGFPSEIMKTFHQLLFNRREMRQRTNTDGQNELEQQYTKMTLNESDEEAEREEEESSDSSVEVSGARLEDHSASEDEGTNRPLKIDAPNNDTQQEGEEDIEVDIDAAPASLLSGEEIGDDLVMNGGSPELSQLLLEIENLADGDLHLHEKTTLYNTLKGKLDAASSALEQRAETIQTSIQKFEQKIVPMRTSLFELEEGRARLEKKIKPLTRQLQSAEIKYFKRVIEATLTQQKLTAMRHHQQRISERQAIVDSEFDTWTQKLNEPLSDWTAEDIVKLLTEVKLDEYRAQFLTNDINGAVLTSLATTDLVRDLRMEWRHAKQLLVSVKALQHGRSIYEQPSGVRAWTVAEVCAWLVDVGHGKHSKIFEDKQVCSVALFAASSKVADNRSLVPYSQ
jgi:hypothetical protein